MPKIESVIFLEAVTVANKTMSSIGAKAGYLLTEDAVGVSIGGLVKVPWSNVKFATYAAEPAKAKP